MPNVVGIRFKRAGRVYYFDPAGMDLKVNDRVVVKTARGMELGQVVIAPEQVLESEITEELKPVLRKAEEADVKRAEEFAAKEKDALAECAKLVEKLGLPMKLLCAEYSMDGTRLTIYFTAEERVDFRKLVQELNSLFKMRVELRQIGPRDEAKLIGGMGRCGRPLCCANFLCEFAPVGIKMAKEQELPLDPSKISGVCGRLMCCLVYESEQYRAMKEQMPRKGQRVTTPAGKGRVTGVNVLKSTVTVELESEATVEFPVNKVTVDEADKAKAKEEDTEPTSEPKPEEPSQN